MIQEFADVFLEEIPGLPPKRDIFYHRIGTGGSPNFSSTLQNECTRINRTKDAIAGAVGQKIHSPQCVPLGSPGIVCEEQVPSAPNR